MKVRKGPSEKVIVEISRTETALPPISLPEFQLKRILVPVDFSDCSRKALQYAASFARQFSAEVTLLHVVVVVPPPQMLVFESEALRSKYQEEAERHLAEWRKSSELHASIRIVVRHGTSANQEIVATAHDCNSDLIVIGNHGRSGLARMLMGSTAERVVRHAPCPVLVVRGNEREFLAGTTTESSSVAKSAMA